jgi:hypothetical protein
LSPHNRQILLTSSPKNQLLRMTSMNNKKSGTVQQPGLLADSHGAPAPREMCQIQPADRQLAANRIHLGLCTYTMSHSKEGNSAKYPNWKDSRGEDELRKNSCSSFTIPTVQTLESESDCVLTQGKHQRRAPQRKRRL